MRIANVSGALLAVVLVLLLGSGCGSTSKSGMTSSDSSNCGRDGQAVKDYDVRAPGTSVKGYGTRLHLLQRDCPTTAKKLELAFTFLPRCKRLDQDSCTMYGSKKSTTSTSEASATQPTVSSAQQEALDYIDKHGADANRVQAYVLTVQIAILDLQKHSTQAKVNALALAAQEAHDGIDALRNNFAESGGSDAQTYVFMGANDLKNAMGALVGYAGTPNAATLAHFQTQYGTARAEWNSGVRPIWRAAKRKPPAV